MISRGTLQKLFSEGGRIKQKKSGNIAVPRLHKTTNQTNLGKIVNQIILGVFKIAWLCFLCNVTHNIQNCFQYWTKFLYLLINDSKLLVNFHLRNIGKKKHLLMKFFIQVLIDTIFTSEPEQAMRANQHYSRRHFPLQPYRHLHQQLLLIQKVVSVPRLQLKVH